MPARKGKTREQVLIELFTRLSKAIRHDGDYFSHLTALFLQGLTSHPPDLLTAVSPRRRRKRTTLDHALSFIYHPLEKCRPTQEITWNNLPLTISTPEKTLIDLVQDLDYSPPIGELAQMFASLPYHLPTLLQLARSFSDTVHKRVLFLTAWAGRAALEDLPFADLTRTPIKLDPRETEDLAWDGRFYTKYPRFLLTLPVPSAPRHEDRELREFMELRGFPPVIEALTRRGSFVIRKDTERRSVAWFDEFAKTWFLSLCPLKLEEFLIFSVTGKTTPDVTPVPAALRDWLFQQERAAHLRSRDIRAWVTINLAASNLDRLETAMFWGMRVGLADSIVPVLRSQGHYLFNAGRLPTLQKITTELLSSQGPMPPHVYVLAGRCLARESRFEECLSILDRGKEETLSGHTVHEDYGDLACVTGQVFRQLHKYPQALTEFFVAREWYIEHKDHARLSMAEAGIGNVFFCQGNAPGARSHYLAALTAIKHAKQPHAEASILGNLGSVEYDSGRLRRALLFLNRALALHHMLKNKWNISVLGGSRAKILLTMGYFTKSMRGFQEVHRLKQELNHPAGVSEAAALLAWICELMGRSAAAKSWWSLLPAPETLAREPRVHFLIAALRAMTALYQNRLTEARDQYHELYELARRKDASEVESGDSLHGIGVCEALLQNPQAPQLLQRAMDALGGNPGRIMLAQLRIFARVFYPDTFPSIDLADQLQRYIDSQAYDPFWALYAQSLLGTGIPEAQRFLAYHLRKTPPSMLQTQLRIAPTLYKVLQKVEKRNLRAAEFLSHIDEEGISPVHIDQYRQKHGQVPEKTFVFDGPIGIVHFGSRRGYLKPRSIPHGILSNLLLAYPQPIETEALYRSVWGMEFDAECDLPAIKSALQRVRRLLKSLTPAVRLVRCLSPSDLGAIRIAFSCPWEAIV
ncbi:MAG TPA: tetratricopeptide repeat protein [Candidatus Ozemobacteraceae bacterium]|nr:tetratricopeptide repeat protein [Candidatus Ozemobacteraceae bacterium]